MVTPSPPKRRSFAAYDLQRIHDLVRSEKVVYAGPKVFRDIENLGYSLQEVCRCLTELNTDNYVESLMYTGDKWQDVYKILFQSTAGNIDDLYIKLKLSKSCVTIILCSFHLDGAC